MSISADLPGVQSVEVSAPGFITIAFAGLVNRSDMYEIEEGLQTATDNYDLTVEFGVNNAFLVVKSTGTPDDQVVEHVNSLLGVAA